MAKVGRKPSENPRIKASVQMLPRHFNAFEALERDFLTDRRAYGSRNVHMDKALDEYFRRYYPGLMKEDL